MLATVPSMCVASHEMPRNIVIPRAAMIASVSAAFRAWGVGTPGTPSAIASTPVSAVAPDENARRMTSRPIALAVVAALWIGSTGCVAGHPFRHWTSPTPIRIMIDATNP